MRFEALCEALLKGGVAPRHVRRYLRELDDHLADLIQAQRDAGFDRDDARARAEATLGSQDELAAAMLAQPSLKSLPARFPWAVFGIIPTLLAVAGFFVPPFALMSLVWLKGETTASAASLTWFNPILGTMAPMLNFLVAPLLAAVMVHIAHTQRMRWVWPVTGAVILALIGLHMKVVLPPHGSLSVGIGPLFDLPQLLAGTLSFEASLFAAQFLLTLLPLAFLAGRPVQSSNA